MRDSITPLLITFNEAPNIGRTVGKLRWAKRVVVIDSGSTDGTVEVLRGYENVEVFERPFTNFAEQWNFGIGKVKTRWVLSLDADYQLSDVLIDELSRLDPPDSVSGYDVQFTYYIFGRPLRGTLYPNRTALFRKDRATYRMDGHTQRLSVQGEVGLLEGRIHHDDRKPLSRWIQSQQHYARDEAEHLLSTEPARLTRADRIRLISWPAPIGVMLYVLFIKGCVLDGWAGWFYVLQRTVAEFILALDLIERRLSRTAPASQKIQP